MSKCKHCGADTPGVLCDGCRAEYEELKGYIEEEKEQQKRFRKQFINVQPKEKK